MPAIGGSDRAPVNHITSKRQIRVQPGNSTHPVGMTAPATLLDNPSIPTLTYSGMAAATS
eukprot:2164181-Rhodomonas_salina.3